MHNKSKAFADEHPNGKQLGKRRETHLAEAGSLNAARRALYETAKVDAEADWLHARRQMTRPPALGPPLMLASLAINVLSLALPLVILQVYDRILPNTAQATLLFLIIGLAVVLLLDGVLRVARSYIGGWEAARFEHMTGCAAVNRILATDVRNFEKDAPGVHLDRLNAVDMLRDYHAGQAKLLIADLPFIALFLGLMWLIAGDLVLVPIGLLLLLFAAALAVGHLLRQAVQERAELDDRRYNFIIEVLSGMATVKGLAMEGLLQRRYERLQENGAASTYRTTFLSNLAQGVGSFFSSLAMVSVAAVGATYVIAGELSIGALAACTLLAGRAIQPPLRALGLWTQLQNVQVARERLDTLFELPMEDEQARRDMMRIDGAIELKNVSFRYDEDGPLLLDGIDLKIGAGEIIGISGGTGHGKSTLLMLILKALAPSSGQVLIDGLDIANCDVTSLRRQIAYLPQSAVLFQGTILDNLTLFRGRDALGPGLQAAELLGLDKLIHGLPAGYDTRVGDGANNELPTGTKQAIAMARALAGSPRIILFDEANSALDSKSDARLKEALLSLKGGPTMVLISHRPSLLALATRVYDLADGKLVPRAQDASEQPHEAQPAPPGVDATALPAPSAETAMRALAGAASR